MKYLKAEFRIAHKGGNDIEDMALLQIAKDILCEYAGDAGFESFEEDGNFLIGYVQEGLLNKSILDENISNLPISGISISYTINQIDDVNWNKTWEEEGFEPIVIKDKCIIHDTLHNKEHVGNNYIDITIDVKQAFGTGTHETTAMIISELLDMNLNNKSVLDCGCGTGILSIVASKSDANTIVGYDIDEWSVKNTMHNCEVNDAGNVNVIHGDASVLRSINTKFDVVMANINRNILLADMPSFKKVMDKNAVLIISGFYMQDVEYLKDKAAELNLRFVKRETMNDWCMLKFINTDD